MEIIPCIRFRLIFVNINSVLPFIATIHQGSLYQIHLWRLTAEDNHLRQELEGHGLDLKPIAGWHSKRQQEWLTGRYLAHKILPNRISDLLVSPNGKPYFENSTMHFSISHSGDLLGMVVSESLIGLDIQRYSKSVKKVAHKFITEDNLAVFPDQMDETDRQHILWCTKEAVFKAYGLGKVDFRKDILIESYDKQSEIAIIKGSLINTQVNRTFTAHYNRMGNYYIVSAIIDEPVGY